MINRLLVVALVAPTLAAVGDNCSLTNRPPKQVRAAPGAAVLVEPARDSVGGTV